jgi:putative phosphoribosyl transferase
MRLFEDRYEAGRALGEKLAVHAGRADVVVLGLPRGGVPLAREVARRLRAPLDVFVVRKLGVPGQEELAMGAVASQGVVVLNHDIVDAFRIPPGEIEAIARREMGEVERRERLYRAGSADLELAGRTVVLVDDGLATGATMTAAVLAARQLGPARIIVAVPVAAASTVEELEKVADEVVVLATPEPFYAVGQWYSDFEPTSDDEVRAILSEPADRRAIEVMRDVEIMAEDVTVQGDLSVPPDAGGIVIFAHGSGSSRHSPRNQFVSRSLEDAGFATLLMDLLTQEEEDDDRTTGKVRFDVDLLASRLAAATEWAKEQASTRDLDVGYFGASTGAAAALIAAAKNADDVRAVVSRGGRPDLARSALSRVRAPTLLIVGAHDPLVVELNRDAYASLRVEKRFEVVPRATHLFEEPGALERVAELALDWFVAHLGVEAARPEELEATRPRPGAH